MDELTWTANIVGCLATNTQPLLLAHTSNAQPCIHAGRSKLHFATAMHGQCMETLTWIAHLVGCLATTNDPQFPMQSACMQIGVFCFCQEQQYQTIPNKA